MFYLHPNFNPYLMGSERNKDLQQLERGRNEWANSIRWKGHRARPKGRNIAPAAFTATLESSRTLIRDCSEAQVRCSGNCPERERGGPCKPCLDCREEEGTADALVSTFRKRKSFNFNDTIQEG